MISVVENEIAVAELLPLFKVTASDDQDAVRFMSINTAVALLNKLSSQSISENILPIIKELSTDNAWRVRYVAADRFHDVIIF